MLDIRKYDGNVIITFPEIELNKKNIQKILERLKFELIISKSQLTQEEANNLAEEVNESIWEKNKSRFFRTEQ